MMIDGAATAVLLLCLLVMVLAELPAFKAGYIFTTHHSPFLVATSNSEIFKNQNVRLNPLLGAFITGEADKLQRELSSAEIFALFEKRWLQKTYPLELVDFTEKKADDQSLGINLCF